MAKLDARAQEINADRQAMRDEHARVHDEAEARAEQHGAGLAAVEAASRGLGLAGAPSERAAHLF